MVYPHPPPDHTRSHLPKLHRFAADCNTTGLLELIQDGCNLNEPHGRLKFTALHFACDKGQTSAAELLLQSGADPNVKDEHGATAVHWAAGAGKIDLFNIIVTHRGFVHAEDANGATPVHWAAAKGHVEVLNVLLSRGAPLEQQDKLQMTPLHRAAIMGHDEAARVLLREGADPSRQDKDGNTALHLACEAGQVGVVRAILSSGAGAGAAYGTMNHEGLTPTAVVERGHKGALPLLSEFRVNLTVAPYPPKTDPMVHILQRSADYVGGGASVHYRGGGSESDEAGGFGVTVDGAFVDGTS